MITGIQITKAKTKDQALVNSFRLLNGEKRKSAAFAAKSTMRDHVVRVSDLV